MSLSAVQIITVWVKDVDNALDFYCNKLGLEKAMDETFGEGERFTTVTVPGDSIQIALNAREQDRVGGMTGIVFGSQDPKATAEELASRGVEITDEPTEQEWGGVMGMFADPCGNVFVLHSQGP